MRMHITSHDTTESGGGYGTQTLSMPQDIPGLQEGNELGSESTVAREMKRRKVLLIAFDFPPRRTSGVYRPTGIIRHLLHLGWETTVLTVDEEGEAQDSSLLSRVPPEINVVRTRYLRVNGWEEAAAGPIRATGALRPAVQSGRPVKPSLRDQLLRRLAALARSILYYPDETVGWVPFGLRKALQLLRSGQFEAVYASSPPRSALVIALLLSYLRPVPWVAEFRDPWYPTGRPLRDFFERRLLRLIARRSKAVVVPTRGHAEDMRRSFNLPPDKVAVIPNGFDEEDFGVATGAGKSSCLVPVPGLFNLTHFGTVYENSCGEFFEALADLLTDCPILKERICVNVVGYPDDAVARNSRREPLKSVMRIHPFLPHAEAVKAMRSSDCLLLFWGRPDFSRLAIAGKTYEYLRSGRPIFAVTCDGGIKTLVETAKAGWAVHPDDRASIKKTLRELLVENRIPVDSPERREFVAQFRYDRLAAQLAAVFDKTAGRGSKA